MICCTELPFLQQIKSLMLELYSKERMGQAASYFEHNQQSRLVDGQNLLVGYMLFMLLPQVRSVMEFNDIIDGMHPLYAQHLVAVLSNCSRKCANNPMKTNNPSKHSAMGCVQQQHSPPYLHM